ncbi:aldo/keto reductase [Pseudoduganella namucuonensis]|uniref:D-threo-aldose 1-dehydrogenase n=1 Tax=Pseudoduganella namucuonensis TaxID=1035707 RepID=A0A1I7LU49_9BURK|nr:aldo/keto reductase [Pseudoduganella namucuonensis]SFV13266.1 D-threo-aldose 1-dehydrogenase [Pseudoduganella namucuonensis]
MRAADTLALPRGGVRLTRLGMGCAPIGGLYHSVTEDEARAAIDAAWDLGLRYFDTAPYYGGTRSELRLGAALRDRPRDQYVVSTKAGRLMRLDISVRPGDDGWADPLPFRPSYDYTYDGVMRSHDDSVRRMSLGRVDMLFVHDIGRSTHGGDHWHHWRQLTKGGGFRALRALREEGRVRAIGLGVNEAEAVHAAMQECELDCTVLAGRYTLLEQASLTPLLDACVRHGNAIVIGGPFNSGVLAGNGKFDYADAPARVLARVEAIGAVCREYGVPLQAAALQFPMAHPAVVSCIPGAHGAAQLRQNAAWFDQPIPPQLWRELKRRGLLDERAPVDEGARIA